MITLNELREYYNSVPLNKLVEGYGQIGVLKIFMDRLKSCPSIPRDTHVVYDKLAEISAYIEQHNPEFLKAVSGLSRVELVRAVEYVLKEQPNVGVEDTAIFVQLADAWQNAKNEQEVAGYTVIMTALQALGCIVAGTAPALDPKREQQIEFDVGGEQSGFAASTTSNAQDLASQNYIDASNTVYTFESMQNIALDEAFGGNYYNFYVQNLQYLSDVLENIEKFYKTATDAKKPPKDCIDALYCLYYIDRFFEYLPIIDVNIEVSSFDTSKEACQYREVVGLLDEHRQNLETYRKELIKRDSDLEQNYSCFKDYRFAQENLDDKIANRAYSIFSFSGSIAYVELGKRVEKLERIGDEDGYPRAYLYAMELNYFALSEIKGFYKSHSSDTELKSDPFSEYSCKDDIPKLLAKYYNACYKEGGEALRRFEAEIFCKYYEIYGEEFNYFEPLMNELTASARCEEEMKAAHHYVQIMNRYVKSDKKKLEKRQKMADELIKASKKREFTKPQKITILSVFAAVWLLVSVLYPLIFVNIENPAITFYASVGILAVLLPAQLLVTSWFPEINKAVRIFIPICYVGSLILAYVFGAVLQDPPAKLIFKESSMLTQLFAPILLYGVPCFWLSFSNSYRLQYISRTIKMNKIKTILFALSFTLLALIWAITSTYLGFLGCFVQVVVAIFVAITWLVLSAGSVYFCRPVDVSFKGHGREFAAFINVATLIAFLFLSFTKGFFNDGLDVLVLVQLISTTVALLFGR